jgi:hypothetical protein
MSQLVMKHVAACNKTCRSMRTIIMLSSEFREGKVVS